MTEPHHLSTKIGIDAEELAGHRFPYQEDIPPDGRTRSLARC